MISTQQQSLKLTRNQELVLTALNEAGTPMSAYALLDNLRAQGLRAPPQIYRALEKLVSVGLVHRLESVNSFVACQHSHGHLQKTVAFTICNTCERVAELSSADLSKMMRNIAKTNSFGLEHSVVELRGQCQACSTIEAG